MTASDNLQASIAGALVSANLAFATSVGKANEGIETRLFRLNYQIGGNQCVVTGYATGAILTVIGAIRVNVPAGQFIAKWHEVADFIIARGPLIRLREHPYRDGPEDENIVWVEAGVPVPPNGAPLDPWIAIAPFIAVPAAINAIVEKFPEVQAATARSFPLIVAERGGDTPQQLDPET